MTLLTTAGLWAESVCSMICARLIDVMHACRHAGMHAICSTSSPCSRPPVPCRASRWLVPEQRLASSSSPASRSSAPAAACCPPSSCKRAAALMPRDAACAAPRASSCCAVLLSPPLMLARMVMHATALATSVLPVARAMSCLATGCCCSADLQQRAPRCGSAHVHS